MKKNILIAGILSAISLPPISQASDNPWEYYWAGSSQKKSRSYSQAYEQSGFGIGVKGVYAWTSELYQPNLAGALLDIHQNVATASVIHQFSLTSGYMAGSDNFEATYYGTLHQKRKLIPVLGGYTLHLPMSDAASFYLGVKGGIAFTSIESRGSLNLTKGAKVSQTVGMFTANAGFNFAISEHAKFVLGYECMVAGSNALVWHAIEAGFSWDF